MSFVCSFCLQFFMFEIRAMYVGPSLVLEAVHMGRYMQSFPRLKATDEFWNGNSESTVSAKMSVKRTVRLQPRKSTVV